jgi:transcriptional regulator GlxA family with amidase domain
MKIEILIYDGFDELDAIGPYEPLSGAGLDTKLVSLADEGDNDGPDPGVIVASHGARIVPHARLSERPDLLIVPGGGWRSRSEHGTRAEYDRGVIPAAIAERHAAGSRIASVCTGAMLLAKAGLLTGRPAVTHHTAFDDLAAEGADVIRDARVVDDGDILTAGGVTSGLDLALWLIECELGRRVADIAAAELEHRRRDEVWQRAAA